MTAAVFNLVDLLRQRVRDWPDRAAYIFLAGEELRQWTLTYEQLDLQARKIAAFLQSCKARGERALLLYPPGLEFIGAFFGCLYAGVVAVPAYPPRLNRNALRIVSMAADSKARLALTTAEVLARLPAITAHTPELGTLKWCATDSVDPDKAEQWREPQPKAEDLAYLQYTSGSTATPKGVMITHANVVHNSGYLARALCHSAQDVSLSWLPHFHDLGLVHGIIQPLYSAFTGYLMAPMSFLQRPLDWLRAISRFRVTHSDGPNFAYELCLNKISEKEKAELDLSSWKMALNGAEPVFPETLKRFIRAFAPCGFQRSAFFPAYGLAEATLVVSGAKKEPGLSFCCVSSEALEQNKIVFAKEGSPGSRLLAASGAIGPGMEVQVVDPASGGRCAPDQIGEIWVAGPSVAAGYWKRPQESEQVFRAAPAGTTEHRFLRTGDMGFVRDGYLFITGRLKEMIIIRGRNFYPQDIERTAQESSSAIRLGSGAAFSVPAATGERLVLVQEVHRRQKADLDQIFSCIRAAIAEEHEIHIDEIVLVPSGSIPKTSSGKIQRRLCRQDFLQDGFEVSARWRLEESAPGAADTERNPEDVQAWLLAQVASTIGVAAERINAHRSLVSLGLDSLGAVELAHKIERTLGLVCQVESLLEDTTIAELAAQAAKSSGNLRDRIVARLPAAPIEYGLSYGQQGLWFLQQLAPESTAYNLVQAVRITSIPDVPALQHSFQQLVDRHHCLRSIFTASNGDPMQRISGQPAVAFFHENARDWSETHLQQRLAREAAHHFDLEHGPLLRIHLLTRGAEDHVLLLTAHHLILDLWSFARMMRELGVLYEASKSGTEAALPAAGSSYSEFVDWQKAMLSGDRGRQLWAYWSRQLCGEIPVLNLLTDHPRPSVQSYRGSSYPFRLGAELTTKLRQLGQGHGVTLYMTLLAAFQALLHIYTGDEEILVGSPAAGRTNPEFASTIGYFVNPLALRTSVPPGCTFEQLLAQVRSTVLDALAHQDYPFSLLVEKLGLKRDASRAPLFQVMFAYQKAPLLHEEGLSLFALGEEGAHMNLGALELHSMRLEQRIAQFDLSLVMTEAQSGMAATLEYNTDLFESSTISGLANHFTELLHSVAENPSRPVSSLALAPEPETARPAQAGTGAFSSAVLVHELFEQQVARTPESVALIDEGEWLTYKELNERANKLAENIAELVEHMGVRVGLCLGRSAAAIIGLLAILKAGAVYVSIDPEYPKDRIAYLISDAGVEVLITQHRLLHALPAAKVRVLCTDQEQRAAIHGKAPALVNPANPAYIIYTSGSTGHPKGVLISHAALSNHMQWMVREFPLHDYDRVLHKYSLSFDASLEEIFYPLISGAALVVAPSGDQYDVEHLTELMRKHEVTVIDVVPTMLKALLEDGRLRSCATLHRIISGGEALPPDVVRRTYEQLGEVELVNTYGPTEAAITASFHRCVLGENGARIPIGKPVAHSQLYVLDDDLRPVPAGIPGEIYIGGAGLAYGYINRPEITAERFIPDPCSGAQGARLYKTGDLGRYRAEGSLEYIRRGDKQVKVRGFRIELEEIETQLRKLGPVADSVVVLKPRANGDQYIAAYVQCKNGEQATPAQLRAQLQEQLPQYMMPAAIAVLQRFPLLPNGKVDIRALPEPEELSREEKVTLPRNAMEKRLVRIWQEVLGRKEVGIHSNFFELGGDSILSIQLVSRARAAGLLLSPKQVFQFQTIADLARVAEVSFTSFPTGHLPAEGPVPLSPIQCWFFEQDLPEPHFYNQSMMLEIGRALDAQRLESAVHNLVFRHDALRLRFHRAQDGWQQRSGPGDASGTFQHIVLSHLPPHEQLQRIEAVSSQLQSTLNLEAGPLLCAVYFEGGTHGVNRLFIVIHHLVIDSVSWGVILDDLETTYTRLQRSEEIRGHGRSISFKQWSDLLYQMAQSDSVREEFGFWSTHLAQAAPRLPLDHAGENSADSMSLVTASLDREETQLLLREVPRAYRTQINDLLLAALAQALTAWTGEPHSLIDLEGHGREEIVGGADPSCTVGWLTSLFPVRLKIDPAATAGETLKSVKEQLRQVPGKGIGYGLLRYLCRDEHISRQLESFPQAQVSFNYLGQLDRISPPDALFGLTGFSLKAARSTRGRRSHLLEIDAYIKDGQFQCQWAYSNRAHDKETIQQLAGKFIDNLRALTRHCVEREWTEYTPSDFTLVKLTQQQIEQIQGMHSLVEDVYPLSPMQRGMLFHSLFEPRRASYLTQFICELEGDLDRAAFGQAWQQVVDNYAALRAGFEWEIVSDEPVQVIRRRVDLPWQHHNWSKLTDGRQEIRLAAYLKENREREIDLRQAPLMRFSLIQTAAARHVFIWSSHHLIMDGWSLPIVLGDVLHCYAGLRRQQPVRLSPEQPFREYIRWLNQQDRSGAEQFWKRSLEGFNRPASLDFLRRARADDGGDEDFREQLISLSAVSSSRLRALAREFRVTLNTILEGAWALLLSRKAGKNEVVVGVVCSGRPAQLVGVESMVGLFINTLPLRVRVDERSSLVDWLKQLQQQHAEITQFDYTPLSQLQSWGGSSRGRPLFESILVFENYPAVPRIDAQAAGLRIVNPRSREKSNYPLTLWVMPGPELCLKIGYDSHRLDDVAIAALIHDFQTLLEAIAEGPHCDIAAVLQFLEATGTRPKRLPQAEARIDSPRTGESDFAASARQGEV